MKPTKLYWLEAVKGIAILGIILNHIVEKTGSYTWFTNPDNNWPSFTSRFHNWPMDGNILTSLIKLGGWLGDSFPGVFIMLSGFGLTYSYLNKKMDQFNYISFLKSRFIKIFPLYIAIHLLINIIAYYHPIHPINPFTLKNILSIIGLRIGSIFMYLNPSWWFIGTILQLYLIFPLLYKLLLKINPYKFIGIMIIITILFRGICLSNPSKINLYMWMTGMFCGTRLAEFAIGMILAKLLVENILSINNTHIFKISIPIYAIGLLCSFFYWSTILSNFFVTVGLFGISLFIGQQLLNFNITRKTIVSIGKYSFAIFLIHQPFIQWTNDFIPSMNNNLAIICGLFISILFAIFFERISLRLIKCLK